MCLLRISMTTFFVRSKTGGNRQNKHPKSTGQSLGQARVARNLLTNLRKSEDSCTKVGPQVQSREPSCHDNISCGFDHTAGPAKGPACVELIACGSYGSVVANVCELMARTLRSHESLYCSLHFTRVTPTLRGVEQMAWPPHICWHSMGHRPRVTRSSVRVTWQACDFRTSCFLPSAFLYKTAVPAGFCIKYLSIVL